MNIFPKQPAKAHIIVAAVITVLAFVAAFIFDEDQYHNILVITATAAHILNMIVFGINLWHGSRETK